MHILLDRIEIEFDRVWLILCLINGKVALPEEPWRFVQTIQRFETLQWAS